MNRNLRRHSLAVAAVSFLAGVTNGAEGFEDNFLHPHAVNRTPVTWQDTFQGSSEVVDGDLVLTSFQPGGLAGAYVPEFDGTDVAVESQFRILGGDNAGIAVRYRFDGGVCYFADVNASNRLAQLFLCGSIPLTNSAPVEVDPSQEDVILRLQAVGQEISLWVWKPGDPQPTEPLLTAQHDFGLSSSSGSVGLYVNGTGPEVSQAAFRYFNTTVVPEPTAAMCFSFGLICLAVLRPVRDFHRVSSVVATRLGSY